MTGPATWIAGLAAAGLVAVAAGAVWPLYRRMTGAHLARKALDAHCAALEPYVRTLYPPGAGPFPAVLLFHGCGGVRQVTQDYADAAVKAGVAAVIVDSLTMRGIGYEQALRQVCTGRALWGRERAADVIAALELVRADPRLNPDSFALAGWSHGGWTVLDAMTLARQGRPPDGVDSLPDAPFSGVVGVFLIYPFVSRPALAQHQDWSPEIPIEAVLVDKDSMARDQDAAAALTRMRERGAAIAWSTLDGVTHGFDEPDHHPESKLRYDDAAAAATRARFVDFLSRRLAPKPV